MRSTIKTVLIAAATSALVAGAAGAEASNLVTSANIKNGTIRLADMSPSTVRALKGKRGPQGIPGAPGYGTVGPAGPAGPSGTFNATKLTFVQGADVIVAPGQVSSAAADCPAGQTAIGGGWFSGVSQAAGEGRSGSSEWFVVVVNDSGITVNIRAYALCLAP